jgi:molybdopterin-guanine dinucleotide biosynthesis protein A
MQLPAGIAIMTDVDGLILAAGRSRRMVSGNKVQSLLAGKTLLQHAIKNLSPQVEHLFINGDPELCTAACGSRPYPFIVDKLDDFQGPLAGLYSALISDHLSPARYLMLAPCDGPFMPENLVAELYRLIVNKDADIACVRYQNVAQPTFSLWDKAVCDEVETALLVEKNGGFKPLLQALNTVYLDWPEKPVNPFFNINNSQDLVLAEAVVCP